MGIFDKLGAAKNIFTAGDDLANAIKTKQWTLAINFVGTFLLVLMQAAHAFGYLAVYNITQDQVNAITGAGITILGLCNHVGAVESTDKINAIGRATVQPISGTGAGAYDATLGAEAHVNQPLPHVVIADDFTKQRESDSLAS